MFKNIQKELLLKNPLSWNLKIIPFAAFALLLHVVFFTLGYVNGAIDFTESDANYSRDFDHEIVIFVSILITTLTFITWLVLYSRNNAFKSFYPKRNASLFKEWLFILLFCILNTGYSVSYFYANDLKVRHYYAIEEANKRFEILSLSSLFLEGAYLEGDFFWADKDDGSGEQIQVKRDSFMFDNRKYSLKSLINKDLESFGAFTSKEDSLNKLKVKRWLTGNRKDSIQWLFESYFKISNEHKLKSNIDAAKWMELVYDYPEFTTYAIVGKSERELSEGEYYYEEETVVEVAIPDGSYEKEPFDSISKTVRTVNGKEYVYYNHYVSFKPLERAYSRIFRAWEHPTVDGPFLLFIAYFAFGLSLLFFSFKVTSGRDWLIALVSMGVAAIVLGIFSLLSGYGLAFPILVLLVFIGLLVYFIVIMKSRKSKQISGITLNQLLWLLPAVLPIIYFVVLEIIRDVSGYNTRYRNFRNNLPVESYPTIEWLQDFGMTFMFLNLSLLFVWMYVFSVQIKKWKGIAEG